MREYEYEYVIVCTESMNEDKKKTRGRDPP